MVLDGGVLQQLEVLKQSCREAERSLRDSCGEAMHLRPCFKTQNIFPQFAEEPCSGRGKGFQQRQRRKEEGSFWPHNNLEMPPEENDFLNSLTVTSGYTERLNS